MYLQRPTEMETDAVVSGFVSEFCFFTVFCVYHVFCYTHNLLVDTYFLTN